MFKKMWDRFGQKNVRFWPSLHAVQNNSQIDSIITETISDKKVSIFGHLSFHKYMQFKKIHRLTQYSLRPFRAKKCPFLAVIPATNTCCSKQFTDWLNGHWDHFGQKRVRIWPSLTTVQNNSQIDTIITETISGKKVSVFGHPTNKWWLNFCMYSEKWPSACLALLRGENSKWLVFSKISSKLFTWTPY